jgi:hypothetical protein
MINTKIAASALLAGAGAAAMVGLAGQAHAAPTAKPFEMYGNPVAAAQYWQQGHHEDCALMSVSYVVGELTGHEPSEDDILAVAEKIGSGPGTLDPRLGESLDGVGEPLVAEIENVVVGQRTHVGPKRPQCRKIIRVHAITHRLAVGELAVSGVVGQFGTHWSLRLRGDDAEAGDDLTFDGYDGVSVVDPRME